MDLVKSLGDLIKVNTKHIEWAKRIQTRKEGKPSVVIVGFGSSSGSSIRDTWIQHRRNTQVTSDMITGGAQRNKIYINEDLSKEVRELLWKTKTELRGIYKYIWVSNGKILVKKADGEQSLRVRALSDISELKK